MTTNRMAKATISISIGTLHEKFWYNPVLQIHLHCITDEVVVVRG